MILTYGSQRDYDAMAGESADDERVSPAELAEMYEFMKQFTEDLSASGELIETQGLSAPAQARRVKLREGAPVVTDGPYAETEEVLAGFWIVDCASFDRATEIAARLEECPGPASTLGTDVRPVMGGSSEELED